MSPPSCGSDARAGRWRQSAQARAARRAARPSQAAARHIVKRRPAEAERHQLAPQADGASVNRWLRMPIACGRGDVLRRVVDEQALSRRGTDLSQDVAEDRRLGLDQAQLARDEDRGGTDRENRRSGRRGPAEGFGRPVGQGPEGHAGARPAPPAPPRSGAIGPATISSQRRMIGLYPLALVRVAGGQLGHGLGEAAARVEGEVPGGRADLGQEALHCPARRRRTGGR